MAPSARAATAAGGKPASRAYAGPPLRLRRFCPAAVPGPAHGAVRWQAPHPPRPPGRHGGGGGAMIRQPSEDGSSITSLLRAVSQWLIGVALVVLLTLFFVAISAVQLSSEGTGQRLLRRSVAVSPAIDPVLPGIAT